MNADLMSEDKRGLAFTNPSAVVHRAAGHRGRCSRTLAFGVLNVDATLSIVCATLKQSRMRINLIKLILLCAGMFILPLAGNAESTNQLRFPIAGFSIAPLEDPPGGSIQQPLMMFLPITNNFAANVNVQIQPYPGTMDEYMALTEEQFKRADFNLLRKNPLGKTTVVFEYTGDMQGRALHWYAKAEKSGDKVYLVTATSSEDEWSKLATRLKACVDSFRCIISEKSSAASAGPPNK
jgi:hypothetical protein